MGCIAKKKKEPGTLEWRQKSQKSKQKGQRSRNYKCPWNNIDKLATYAWDLFKWSYTEQEKEASTPEVRSYNVQETINLKRQNQNKQFQNNKPR